MQLKLENGSLIVIMFELFIIFEIGSLSSEVIGNSLIIKYSAGSCAYYLNIIVSCNMAQCGAFFLVKSNVLFVLLALSSRMLTWIV